MFDIVAIVLLIAGIVAILLQPVIARARRRRRRAERRARHDRIERDWTFAQSLFGPRSKRLTHDGREVDAADD